MRADIASSVSSGTSYIRPVWPPSPPPIPIRPPLTTILQSLDISLGDCGLLRQGVFGKGQIMVLPWLGAGGEELNMKCYFSIMQPPVEKIGKRGSGFWGFDWRVQCARANRATVFLNLNFHISRYSPTGGCSKGAGIY
jgi:hypothetical protein